MQAREALRERVGLGVDDEVDAALPIQDYVLVPMARDRLESEALEEGAHRLGVGRGVLDELEAVGTRRVIPCVGHGVQSRMIRENTA